MKPPTPRSHGLTLVEVLLVVATVVLLGAVLLPMIARSQSKPGRGPRIACLSNLKSIGLVGRLWANDNNDEFPWVSTNAAGSRAYVNSPQVFLHFAAMSNELVSPKILICPSDPQRTKATDFSQLSNTNLSYFVALDADESKPNRLLTGDRNITGGTLSNGFLRTLLPTTAADWSSDIHKNAGNIGLSDGSVQQVTPMSLRKQLQAQDLPTIRLAIP